MTIKLAGYAKDDQKVKDGVQVNLGTNEDGTKRWILVKPLNSAAYEDRLEALKKPHGRAVERDKALLREIQRRAFCEVCFVNLGGWKGEDGTVIENTLENRIAMCEDRDFYADAITAAGERYTFEANAKEADAGN